MRYVVEIGMNKWESDSKDSKKHLQNHGGDSCAVYTKSGVQVSAAKRQADGTITNVTFCADEHH